MLIDNLFYESFVTHILIKKQLFKIHFQQLLSSINLLVSFSFLKSPLIKNDNCNI